jgi:hypothetical protein
MNQRAFDADLEGGYEVNPENGEGWANNPIAQLFDKHRQLSEREFLGDKDKDEEE